MSNRSHATRVLVVDDDAIVRMMLVEQLERAGAKPVAADSGEEALLLWEIGGFSIVVTDCSMTKMSGFELASEIRHREGSLGRPPCHVWGYTGNASDEAVKRGSESGMDGLIAKPATPDDLRRMLNGASTETTRVAGYESGAFSNGGLYRQWLADVRSDLALASAHYAAGDLAAVAWQLHKMKGAASVIGNGGVAQACADAERMSADGDDVGPMLEFIDQALSRLQR